MGERCGVTGGYVRLKLKSAPPPIQIKSIYSALSEKIEKNWLHLRQTDNFSIF